jgi:hypothetical protein
MSIVVLALYHNALSLPQKLALSPEPAAMCRGFAISNDVVEASVLTSSTCLVQVLDGHRLLATETTACHLKTAFPLLICLVRVSGVRPRTNDCLPFSE